LVLKAEHRPHEDADRTQTGRMFNGAQHTVCCGSVHRQSTLGSDTNQHQQDSRKQNSEFGAQLAF